MQKIRATVGGALLKFLQSNKDNAPLVIWFPSLLQIILCLMTFFMPGLFGLMTIGVQAVLTVFTILACRFFASELDEIVIKRNLLSIFASLMCLMAYILSLSFIYVSWRTGHNIRFMAIGGFIIAFVISFATYRSEALNNVKEKIIEAEEPTFDPGLKKLHSGDIVLCDDRDLVSRAAADPRVVIPAKDRFLHMLILGATGSGKTSQVLLPMINQDTQNPDVGVIVLDPKGDLAQQAKFIAEHHGRKVVKYFDPSMKNCPKFNPMAGNEMDVVENMAMTFRMLMPDSSTFFLDLSEQLVRYSVKMLKRLDAAAGIEGKYANLNTLSRVLQNTSGDGTKLVGEFRKIKKANPAELAENAEICDWFMRDYFPSGSKNYENTSGIRSQVTKICSNEYLRDVLNPDVEHGEKNDIDFDKALEDGEVLCISTAQGVLRGLSKFLGYFLILQLQSAVFRRPGSEDTRRPCFLYIDEFQTYSTPGFADMLTMGRSYRVASHLATQARSQMEMGGGKDGKDFVSLVSTNARNVVLFPGCSFQDADYYSKQFGEHEEYKITRSQSRSKDSLFSGEEKSRSVSKQKTKEANISATSIIYRPFGEITYSIIKNNTLQAAKVGKVKFIDKELKKEIDEKIKAYVEQYAKKPGVREEDDPKNVEIVFDSEEDAPSYQPKAFGQAKTQAPAPAPKEEVQDPLFSVAGESEDLVMEAETPNITFDDNDEVEEDE